MLFYQRNTTLSVKKKDNGWVLTVFFEPLHVVICFVAQFVHPANEGTLLICIIERVSSQYWHRKFSFLFFFLSLQRKKNWPGSRLRDSYFSYEPWRNRKVFLVFPHRRMQMKSMELQRHASGRNSPLLGIGEGLCLQICFDACCYC